MYKKISVSSIEDDYFKLLYANLLEKKYSFMILYFNEKKFVLTKEGSIMEIDHEDLFLKQVNKDRYYRTIICIFVNDVKQNFIEK